jgi:hypothetical protein
MKKWIKENWYFMFGIFLIAFLLFYKAALSKEPLGLDTLGHLSKVSYIFEYPFSNWDMSWYSGTLFLKLYPPLFYYLAAFFSLIFSNTFFAANLICFSSLVLTLFGIYLLVEYLTKNRKIAFFSSLGFLTVISLSYYWISAGNLPYFFALFTIPFSLYFLERSIKEKEKKFFVFYSLFFFIGIITHVVVGFIIGISMVIRIFLEGFSFHNFKKILIYGGVPVLLAGFWFFPFVANPTSLIEYEGYIPNLLQPFGFNDFFAWGLHAGGIGIFSFLFLFAFLMFVLFFVGFKKNKNILFYSIISILLLFIFFGGLGKHYPYGVDAVRFVLPLSMFMVVFVGLIINQFKFKENKIFIFCLIILLAFGLSWNYKIVNKNFEDYSYYDEWGRYQIFSNIIDKGFPLENEFQNYRFGTCKFVFSENLNYFMPNVPQTFGYQDVGMLNPPRYYDMRWNIFISEDVEDSISWLDWFGIKYFEIENSEVSDKFLNDSRFKLLMDSSGGYNFKMYEYADSKPIISIVDNLQDDVPGNLKEFDFNRVSPDIIEISYKPSDENDVILFKEFYYKNWKAKELPSGNMLEIKEVGPGFMGVYPQEGSEGVVFFYKKSLFDYISIFLSFFGAFLLLKLSKKSL